MSIFGKDCDDMESELNRKHVRPEKKKDMKRLKEVIKELKGFYEDAISDRDYDEATVLKSEICTKEKELTSLVDGY